MKTTVAPAAPRRLEGSVQFSPGAAAKLTLELSPPGPRGAPAEASVGLEGAIFASGKGSLYEGQVRMPLEGSGITPGRGYIVTTELEPHLSAHVQFWHASTRQSFVGTSTETSPGSAQKSDAAVP